MDGAGHFAARSENLVALAVLGCGTRFASLMYRLVSGQIADVGNHPILAGLDEPVVVELEDIVFHDVDLFADNAQQVA